MDYTIARRVQSMASYYPPTIATAIIGSTGLLSVVSGQAGGVS